jgi:hypothetical protein
MLFLSFKVIASVSSAVSSELHLLKKNLTDSTSQKIFYSSLAAVYVASQNDESTRFEWVNYQKMSKSTARYGDYLGTGIPGLLIASYQFYWLDQNDGKKHYRALVSAALATYAIKYLSQKKRPGESNDRLSFPSGHTSTAFASATVLTYSYGWKAAVMAYPLAILTGASRLADDAHWISDVVGGAFLGILFGRASSLDENEPQSKIDYMILPSSVQLVYRF